MKDFRLIVLLLVFSCINKSGYSQDEVKHPDLIVTGYCSVNDFKSNPKTSEWFVPGYAGYVPDESVMKELKILAERNYTFTIVLGTWCGDSKEQVPHFFKIADEAGFVSNDMNIICVDRTKKAEGIDLSSFNIVKVPTFIVLLDEEEIGRIIETPELTVEKDLLNIFNNSKINKQ